MNDSRSVLIVEDEALIAMDMELALTDLGWRIVGPASTANEALGLIERSAPDVAVLDFNLRNGTSEGVASDLIAKDIPLLFLSGDGRTTSRVDGLSQCPVLTKPVEINEIHTALEQLLGGS